MSTERCYCDIRPGMTYDELRHVKSCQDRWICNTLVNARRAAEKKEASRRRIAELRARNTPVR